MKILERLEGPVLHVRFAGRTGVVALSVVGVSVRASDAELRGAIARYLEVPERELAGHVIERHANGNVSLRPEAVFG